MGAAVGEGFLEAAREAIKLNIPLVIFIINGGARMQEGIFSLMQLPKTVVAVNELKEKKFHIYSYTYRSYHGRSFYLFCYAWR